MGGGFGVRVWQRGLTLTDWSERMLGLDLLLQPLGLGRVWGERRSCLALCFYVGWLGRLVDVLSMLLTVFVHINI